MSALNYIDLFAGAGGLSEGFIKQGFNPVAHVEVNREASDTLRTRVGYHYLKQTKRIKEYYSYLDSSVSRDEFWAKIPATLMESVINEEISNSSIGHIFNKIDSRLDGRADVIVGGPPCQAYSVVGRSRDPNRMNGDKRNFLFKYYAKFLEHYRPKFFVFENVLGLLTAGNSKYFQQMLNLFSSIGYSTSYEIINADDYGVLQKRKRIIIIGRKGNKRFVFPKLDATENKWEIGRDLFYDLPRLNPGQTLNAANYITTSNKYLRDSQIRNGIGYATQHVARPHNERDLEIYEIAINLWINDRRRLKYSDLPKYLRTHKNNDSFLDRFKVVNPTGHSHTIVAHISKDGHHYIYPDLKQIRSISVREAARIQSFPDDYFFEGGRTSAFMQIGNAVPPLMAAKIAASLKDMLLNE
jgi:DNA (cytosine-5)-methyltransferase 1